MKLKRILLGSIMSLAIAFPCSAADTLDLSNSTVLFREDFGGNSPSDPVYVTSDTLSSVTTLKSQPNFPLATDSYLNYHSYSEGCYDVRKSGFHRANSNWYIDFDDHTSSDDLTRGYMMQVDMGSQAATFYSAQIDGLCSNTKLYLSMWGHPVNQSSDTKIQLIVTDLDGNQLASEDVIIYCSKNYWQQVGTYFTVPEGQSSVIYKIYSEGGNGGNDYALDDIEVHLCKPAVQVNTPNDSLCVGSNYTLTASYDNSDASYVDPVNFTWYKNEKNTYSLDGWNEVASGSTLALTNISENAYYKVIVSSAGVAADFTKCNAASDNIPVLVKQCENVTPVCQPKSSVEASSLCKGETFQFGGQSYTATATKTFTYTGQTVDGCDSVVTLNLTVLPTSVTALTASVSVGDAYTENGFSLPAQTAVGSYPYQLLLTNQYGCDSTVNLTLNVSRCSVPTQDVVASICQGESYPWGTDLKTVTGQYTLNGVTALGCDSIVTLHLTVLPVTSQSLAAKVFLGDTYTENGFDLPAQTAVGTFAYQIQTTNQYGCDSIVNLNLSVVEIPVTIPTVFTPYHKDGRNDVFMLGYEVYIYDRYGNMICHSYDGWDGSYRGEVADPGVYIYALIMKDGSKKKGTIEVYK